MMRFLPFLLLIIFTLTAGCGNSSSGRRKNRGARKPLPDPQSGDVGELGAAPAIGPGSEENASMPDAPPALPSYAMDPQDAFPPIRGTVYDLAKKKVPLDDLHFTIQAPGFFGTSDEEVNHLPFRFGKGLVEVRVDSLKSISVGKDRRTVRPYGSEKDAEPMEEVKVILIRNNQNAKPFVGWVSADVKVAGTVNAGNYECSFKDLQRIDIVSGGKR